MPATATPAATSASCGTCGIPFAAPGVVDERRLRAFAETSVRVQAVRRELAQAEQLTDRLEQEVETAERLGDVPGGVSARRRLEQHESHLASVRAALAGFPASAAPTNGACEGCGTVYVGGRVDEKALREANIERERLNARLAALHRDLRAAEYNAARHAKSGSVIVNVYGWVGNDQQIAERIRRELLRTGGRNTTIFGGVA